MWFKLAVLYFLSLNQNKPTIPVTFFEIERIIFQIYRDDQELFENRMEEPGKKQGLFSYQYSRTHDWYHMYYSYRTLGE